MFFTKNVKLLDINDNPEKNLMMGTKFSKSLKKLSEETGFEPGTCQLAPIEMTIFAQFFQKGPKIDRTRQNTQVGPYRHENRWSWDIHVIIRIHGRSQEGGLMIKSKFLDVDFMYYEAVKSCGNGTFASLETFA